MSTIGERIKSLRERAGLKQFELEKAIHAAKGSVSKIEKGKTNPSKETIEKVALALKLSHREIMYLNGRFSKLITIKEIEDARKEVGSILNSENAVAYLLDEKRRVWGISKGLKKIAGITQKDLPYIIGENIFKIICYEDKPGYKLVNTVDIDKMIRLQINRLFHHVPFMFSEQYWFDIVAQLITCSEFKIAWDEVGSSYKKVDVLSVDSRTVGFKFKGYEINLVYTEEQLSRNPRFSIVVYFSTSSMVEVLQRMN